MKPLTPNPSVVCTVLEEGGVLLHLETKYYYSLNRTALAYWLALEEGVADPERLFAARFPGQADAMEALSAFRADLEREALAGAAGAGGGGASPDVPLSLGPEEPWAPPRLTRHDAPLNQILSNPFDPCVPLAE